MRGGGARTISARAERPSQNGICRLVSRTWVEKAWHEKTRPSTSKTVREECQRVHQAQFCLCDEGRRKRAEARDGGPQRKGDRSPRPPAALGFLACCCCPHQLLPRSFWEHPHILLGLWAALWWWRRLYKWVWPGKNQAEKWRETWKNNECDVTRLRDTTRPRPAPAVSRLGTDQRSERTTARGPQ